MRKLEKTRLFKGPDEMERLPVSVKSNRGEMINRSGITNITLFRKYVELCLANHTGINTGKKLMVKLLESSDRGIPL